MISVLDMRSIKKNMGIIDPGFGIKIFSLYAFTQGDFWGGAELAFLELSQAGREYRVEKSSENVRNEYSDIICNINILLHVLMSGPRNPGQAVKLINAFTAPASLLKREASIEKAIQEGVKRIIAGRETMPAHQAYINDMARIQNTDNRYRNRMGTLLHLITPQGDVAANKSGFVKRILSKLVTLDAYPKTSGAKLRMRSSAAIVQRRNAGKAEEQRYSALPHKKETAALTGTVDLTDTMTLTSDAAYPEVRGHSYTQELSGKYWTFAQHDEMLLRRHNAGEAWEVYQAGHDAGHIRKAEAALVVFKERTRFVGDCTSFGARSGVGTPRGAFPTNRMGTLLHLITPQGEVAANKSGFVKGILSKLVTLDAYKKIGGVSLGMCYSAAIAQRKNAGKAEEERYSALPHRKETAALTGTVDLTDTMALTSDVAYPEVRGHSYTHELSGKYWTFAQHDEMLLRRHNAGEAWEVYQAGYEAGLIRTAEAASVVFKERPHFGARSGVGTPRGAFPTNRMGMLLHLITPQGKVAANKSGFVKGILSKMVTLDAYKKIGGVSLGMRSSAAIVQRKNAGKAEDERYSVLPQQTVAAALTGTVDLIDTMALTSDAAYPAVQGHSYTHELSGKYWTFAQHDEMLLRRHNAGEAWEVYQSGHEAGRIRTAEADLVVVEERPHFVGDCPRFGARSEVGTPRGAFPTNRMGTLLHLIKPQGDVAANKSGLVKGILSKLVALGAYAKTSGGSLGMHSSAAIVQRSTAGKAEAERYSVLPQRKAETDLVVVEDRPHFGARSEVGTPRGAFPTNRMGTLLHLITPQGDVAANKSGFVKRILSKLVTLDTYPKTSGARLRMRSSAAIVQRRNAGKADEERYSVLPQQTVAAALTGTVDLIDTMALTSDAAYPAVQGHLHTQALSGKYWPFARHGGMLLRQHNAGEAWKMYESGHEDGGIRKAETDLVVVEERPHFVGDRSRFGARSGVGTPRGAFPTNRMGTHLHLITPQGDVAANKSGFVKGILSKLVTLDAYKKIDGGSLRMGSSAAIAQRRNTGKAEERYTMLPQRTAATALTGTIDLTDTMALTSDAALPEVQGHSHIQALSGKYWPFVRHGGMLLRQHNAGEAWEVYESGHMRTAEADLVVVKERPHFARFGARSDVGTPQGAFPANKSGFVKGVLSKFVTLDAYKKIGGGSAGTRSSAAIVQRINQRGSAPVKANEQAPSELVLRSSPLPIEKAGAKNDNAFISSRTEENSPGELKHSKEAGTTKIKVINESREDLVRAGEIEIQSDKPDISKLADQIYKRLEERLRIERQRRGLFR